MGDSTSAQFGWTQQNPKDRLRTPLDSSCFHKVSTPLTEESPGGWWKMTTSMIAEVSFRNRLMFSNWKGTDAENAIGWFWRCYQWQFFSSTRHRRGNRVGVGTTAHPDLCRGLCSPGESCCASSEDRWFFSSDLALPIVGPLVNAVWLIADRHSPIFSISYPLAVADHSQNF